MSREEELYDKELEAWTRKFYNPHKVSKEEFRIALHAKSQELLRKYKLINE